MAHFGYEIRRAVEGEEIVVNNEALLDLWDKLKPKSIQSDDENRFKEFCPVVCLQSAS